MLDHYDYDLDEAKGLQDKFGRPIQLNEDIKNWFRKAIYDSYVSPSEADVINQRLALDEKQGQATKPVLDAQREIETVATETPELSESEFTAEETAEINKRTIGGGEEKQSKGAIGGAIGATYESTSWDIQEQLVSDYLDTVSIDEALDALDNDTYPNKIDANFLRQALAEKLLENGREMEAAALIEETAEDISESAKKLQATRRLNTPFVNYINLLTQAKAEKLANAKYGEKADSVAKLDSAINELVKKYEGQFINAKNDEERALIFATMQDEAIRTIGTLDKQHINDLDFQDVEDKEERKQAREIRLRQNRRASINAYRARAKRALKQAMGLAPTREQVRQIKKLSSQVSKVINEYRKAVRTNTASAIDPTAVLEAQNTLNEYLVEQVPPKKLRDFADATNSFMMANMLWNPATNVFNIESTLVQMIPHMLASWIDNKTFGTVSWNEKAKIIKEAVKLQAKTGYNIFSLTDFFDKKTLWAEKYYQPTTTAGKLIRMPLTMLGLADTINKGIVFLNHADAMATKQAKAEGKGAERAKELFYQALNTDPRTITADGLKIRQQAVLEGEEATFTQNTETAQAVNKIRKLLNFGKSTGLGNILIPFTTTIANIAQDAVTNYSVGAIKNAIKHPDQLLNVINPKIDAEMRKEAWNAIKPETKNLIKNFIGILLLLSLGFGGDDDDYVLGYNDSTDVDTDIRQNRNAPSSMSIRIGDKWVSTDLFGIGTPLLQAYLVARRYGFTSEGWVKGIAGLRDLIPGVSEVESIVEDFSRASQWNGTTDAIAELGSDQLGEILTRLIPASAFINQIGNIEDPYKREKYNKWYDKIIGKIPFLRKTLPEQRSSKTGKIIPQTDAWANLATGGRIKDYVPATPADKARYEFAIDGKALSYREGNSKLKDLGKDTPEFKRAVARVRQIFTEKLNNVAKTNEYQAMTIEEKRAVVNKLHTEALNIVKKEKGLDKKKK